MFKVFKKKSQEVSVEDHFKNIFNNISPAKIGDVAPRSLFPTDGVYAVRGGLGNRILSEIIIENGIITDIKRFI